METALGCFIFIALAALLIPFALTFAHARKIKALESTLEKLNQRISRLETQPPTMAAPIAPATAGPSMAPPSVAPTSPTPASPPTPVIGEPPPLPWAAPVPAASAAKSSPAEPARPTIAPEPIVPPPLPTPAHAPRAAIDWEAFMGVKLFAWIGGFALFLGVVFLVQYSFANNLITPFMRIVLGAIIGAALVAAGWFTARRNYRVPGQSLCATGVLVLYADIFGAHAFYSLISLTTAFAFMSLITVGAFLLAVRLDAQVVVVLGLVGGFLTPPLLTNSPDQALRLFGYVALLDLGIAAVALRKRWDYLLLLGAIGTVLTEVAWLPGFHSPRAASGFPIFLSMEALFLGFAYLRQRLEPAERWSTMAASSVGFTALAYAFWLLVFTNLASRPGFF
ncbi:MAG TPA: DUF2339 domain-containing protein, partial [Chthoniobacterales bacterium]